MKSYTAAVMLLRKVTSCFSMLSRAAQNTNHGVQPTYHFRVWSFVPTLQKSKVLVLKPQGNGELEMNNLKPCMNECHPPGQYFRESEHNDSCSAVCLMM